MKVFAEGPRLNLEQFDVDRDYEAYRSWSG